MDSSDRRNGVWIQNPTGFRGYALPKRGTGDWCLHCRPSALIGQNELIVHHHVGN
jgi:hypothetical protein